MPIVRRLFAGVAALLAAAAGAGATGDLKHPDWHPDGRTLVSEGSCAGGIGLYLIDTETGQLRLLLDSEYVDGYPRWFPDGDRIAFHRIDDDRNAAVFIVEVDASRQPRFVTRVTTGPFDIEPAPSPDGSMLTFSVAGQRGQDIAVMRLDDGVRRVWETDGPENFPSWTPGGRSILLHGEVSGQRQILQRNLGDDSLTVVTDATGPNLVAHMSPDGRRLAFSSERDGDREIYLRNLRTSKDTRLTTRPGRDGYPKFSPDASRIAYHAGLEGGSTVVRILDLETGASRNFSCADTLPATNPKNKP